MMEPCISCKPALPDAWKEGSVKRTPRPWRLCGGYGLEEWQTDEGEDSFHHRRHPASPFIRTAEGEKLKKAEGTCPNILFASAEVKPVVEQHRIAEGVKVPIPDVYEYDLETEPGKTYLIK